MRAAAVEPVAERPTLQPGHAPVALAASPPSIAALQRLAGNRATAAALRDGRRRLATVPCSAPRPRSAADAALQRRLAASVAARALPGEVREPRPRRRASRRLLQRSPGSNAGGCGVCYGSPRNAGIAAHGIIQQAFRSFYGYRVLTELTFLAPSPTDDDGRLDLLMPTATGFDIGEIKPANAGGLIEADSDLLWYENQIERLFNMRVGRMTLPPPPISLTFPNPQAPGCPSQELFVERWQPRPDGIYLYYCEPDYSVLVRDERCRCNRRRQPVPDPVPVPAPERRRAPRTVLEKVRDFIVSVGEGVADVEEAARVFLRENPEVRNYLIGAAVLIIVVTLAEDIATLGAGLLDDPASFAVALALVRVAQQAR